MARPRKCLNHVTEDLGVTLSVEATERREVDAPAEDAREVFLCVKESHGARAARELTYDVDIAAGPVLTSCDRTDDPGVKHAAT
jgi:hypothetical protein